MSIITNVPSPWIVDPKGVAKTDFFSWLYGIYVVAFSVQESGTTTNRPTKNLFVGRPYFDTTLGKPVWLKSASPSVWVDATGASV